MLVGRIIFSMIFAKVAITIAFDLAYVYSAELFPTTMRWDDKFTHFIFLQFMIWFDKFLQILE